jgi:hypothetical protein
MYTDAGCGRTAPCRLTHARSVTVHSLSYVDFFRLWMARWTVPCTGSSTVFGHPLSSQAVTYLAAVTSDEERF